MIIPLARGCARFKGGTCTTTKELSSVLLRGMDVVQQILEKHPRIPCQLSLALDVPFRNWGCRTAGEGKCWEPEQAVEKGASDFPSGACCRSG